MAVYFEANASPASSPKTSHHRPSCVACSRASAQSAAVQNTSSGRSDVARMLPSPTTIVALNSTAAAMPRRRAGKSESAARASSTLTTAMEIGPIRRMPSAPSHASSVPARMNSATMGGWSK